MSPVQVQIDAPSVRRGFVDVADGQIHFRAAGLGRETTRTPSR